MKKLPIILLIIMALVSMMFSCDRANNPPADSSGTPSGDGYKAVIDAINALPDTVSLEDGDAIRAARAAYVALSGEEQAQVTNLAALTAAEDALAVLESARATDVVYLSDIDWVSWKMYGATSDDAAPAYTPSRNCNEAGGILTINGIEYEKGLRTHPDWGYDAEFVYDISGYSYDTFSSTVGKDSAAVAGYGNCQFQVYGDDILLASSPYLEVGEDYFLRCDITGVKTLRLVMNKGNDELSHDSGGWGNALIGYRESTLTESLAIAPASVDGATFTDGSVSFPGGTEASVSYTPNNIYRRLYATLRNTGTTDRDVSFYADGEPIEVFTVKAGKKMEVRIVTECADSITVSAGEGTSEIIMEDAMFTTKDKPEEFKEPDSDSATLSAREKYDGWLSNLSTFPTSFVYDNIKYYGLGGDDFTEKSRHTDKTELSEETSVTLTHTPSGVEFTLNTVFYPDYDAYEWTIYLTNNTDKKSGVFSELRAAETYVFGSDPVLHGLHSDGDGGASYSYYAEYEQPIETKLVYTADSGKSSFPVFPYYRLSTSDNGGTFIAVSWGGQYYNNFEVVASDNADAVRFTAAQLGLKTYLEPGESIRTPLVAFVEYGADEDEAGLSNIWRRWFIDCNMARVEGKVIQPIVCASASWIYNCMTSANEESQTEAIRSYLEKGILLDYWWMDAGWYAAPNLGTIGNWPDTGVWKPDPKRFPTGFASVSDYADDRGLDGTILWFEVERSAYTAEEIRTVFPEFRDEWLLRDTVGGNTHLMLNLANNECREWITDVVTDIMSTGKIDVYRQDFNWFPSSIWMSYNEPNREGILENLYVQGYYSYFDALAENHPGLIIDTCASGGGRLELETLRRAVPLHRTDYNIDRSTYTQAASQALYNWIPFSGQPTNATLSTTIDTYQIRSVYAPSITLNYDYRVDDADWDLLAALVEECRMVTQFCYADYYELMPWSNTDNQWRGWQFFDAEKNAGVIQLFCPEASDELTKTIKLYGLDPDTTYVLTDVTGLNSVTATGKSLTETGMTITYPGERSSSVIFIDTKAVTVPSGITERVATHINKIPDGAIVVSDLDYVSWKMYISKSTDASPVYTPNFNINELGTTLTIGNILFEKGIRSHPDTDGVGDIVYDISAYSSEYTTFAAYVGKDSGGGAGNIQFEVLVDGVSAAKSRILAFGEYEVLYVPISGGKTLTLRYLDGGDGVSCDSSAYGLPLLLTDAQAALYPDVTK